MESLLTILAFVVGAMLLIFETTLNEEKFYLCFAKSIAYYLCIYGIVSAILLVFNFFDVLLASVISVVFCLIFVIFRAVVLGKISKLFSIKRIIRDIKNRKLSFKMDIVALVIIALGLCCTIISTQYVGGLSENGSYQVGAISFLNGNTGAPITNMRGDVAQSTCFSPLNSELIFGENEYEGSNAVVSSGSPIVSAEYALSATVFGLSGMLIIGQVSLVVAGLLVLGMCERLGLSKWGSRIAIACFSLNPIILWTVKNPNPAVFCILFVVLIAYLAICSMDVDAEGTGDRKTGIFGKTILMSIAYSLAILQTLKAVLFLPLFVFVILYIAIHHANCRVNIASVFASLLTGLCMFFYSSENPVYLVSTWWEINLSNEALFRQLGVLVIPVLCLLVSILLLIKPLFQNVSELVTKKSIFSLSRIVSASAFIIVLVKSLISFDILNNFVSIQNTDLISCSIACGFVIIPLIAFFLIFKNSEVSDHKNSLIPVVFFMCGILLFTFSETKTVTRFDNLVELAPFMFSVALLAGVVFDKRKWTKFVLCAGVLVIVALSARLALICEYSYRWDTIDDARDSISDEALLVVDLVSYEATIPIWVGRENVEVRDGITYFPYYDYDIPEIVFICLSTDTDTADYISSISKVEDFYENDLFQQISGYIDTHYDEDNFIRSISNNRFIRDESVASYESQNAKVIVAVHNNLFESGDEIKLTTSYFVEHSNAFPVAEAGYVWGNFESNTIELQLPVVEENTEVTIDFYMDVLASRGDIDQGVPFDVLINGEVVYSTTLYVDDTLVSVPYEITEQLDGEMIELTIVTTTWSPADYGSTDTRQLSVPLSEIVIRAN